MSVKNFLILACKHNYLLIVCSRSFFIYDWKWHFSIYSVWPGVRGRLFMIFILNWCGIYCFPFFYSISSVWSVYQVFLLYKWCTKQVSDNTGMDPRVVYRWSFSSAYYSLPNANCPLDPISVITHVFVSHYVPAAKQVNTIPVISGLLCAWLLTCLNCDCLVHKTRVLTYQQYYRIRW